MSEFDGHMPGPWKAFQWGDGSQDGTEYWNVGSDAAEVVFVEDLPLADARLIAAAPDLLAQRDALLEALKEIKNADGWHAHEVVYRIRNIAARAITKVRGSEE